MVKVNKEQNLRTAGVITHKLPRDREARQPLSPLQQLRPMQEVVSNRSKEKESLLVAREIYFRLLSKFTKLFINYQIVNRKRKIVCLIVFDLSFSHSDKFF